MSGRLIKLLIITVIIAVFLCSCGSSSAKSPTSGKDPRLTIVTSFYPMYLHTINITRNVHGVRVVNMTKPQTGCLHDYNLTPDNMKTLERAQIFIINGAGMESFMERVTGQFPDINIINASKGIELIKQSSSSAELEYNPHVWVSIKGNIYQVQNISAQLEAIDPANAASYRDNAKAYIKKLNGLDMEMHKTLDTLKSRDIVTFHEAFDYFAHEFNLNIAAAIEKEPGTEPSAHELAATIDIIRQKAIHALLIEPQYSAKAADTIARETGAKIYSIDPVVSGKADGDYDAYIKIMKNNMKVLKEALDE